MILSYRIITNRLYANDYKVIHLPWMKIRNNALGCYIALICTLYSSLYIYLIFSPSKLLYVPQDGFNLEIGTPILCCKKKKSEVHPVQKLNRWRHQVELKTKLWVQFSFGDSSESEQKQLKCNIRFF